MQFNPADYSEKEGVDSNVVIILKALKDHPDIAFTVTVLTQDGSATREYLHSFWLYVLHRVYILFRNASICTLNSGGSDYEGERFTVAFPAGVNVISFNVTIIDDNIAELAELFTLDLEIPAASADMGIIKGSPDTATVHIMDDDGEHIHYMMPFYQCNVILNY